MSYCPSCATLLKENADHRRIVEALEARCEAQAKAMQGLINDLNGALIRMDAGGIYP